MHVNVVFTASRIILLVAQIVIVIYVSGFAENIAQVGLFLSSGLNINSSAFSH
jgi:hypothetical protein